jgi:tetratricopeptide (TPR) repeat protein
MEPVRLIGVLLLTGAVAFAAAAAEPAQQRATVLINSGIAHERLGQNAGAIGEFTEALGLNDVSQSDRVRAFFDRGVAYDALGDTPKAIEDYTAAVRLDPRFGPAYNNRANVYRRAGRLADAKRDYRTALSCPEVSREYPLYGLGQIAEKEGHAAEAHAFYQQALAANPGYALAAQSLGALKFRPDQTLHAAQRTDSEPTPKLPPSAKRPAPKLRNAIVERKPSRAGGTAIQVQFGAYRDRNSTKAAWTKIQALNIAVLRGRTPEITSADLPDKGRLWRLRATVPDPPSAKKLCAALAVHKIGCYPVNG